MVSAGVRQDEEPGLAEGVLELIGEGTGSVTSSDGLASGILREFQNGALTIGPGGLHNDVLGILNRGNHPGGQLKLLVGLPNVDDENTCPNHKTLIITKP